MRFALCSRVSCSGTHLAHNFLNNRYSMTILCRKEREIWGKLLLAQLTMNVDRRYALCIQKIYHRPHFTVGGCWNKSLHHQPLKRCYCENSGSPASACAMRHHYFITYTQSLNAGNGLLAVGRVGNLLCGRPSYMHIFCVHIHFGKIQWNPRALFCVTNSFWVIFIMEFAGLHLSQFTT